MMQAAMPTAGAMVSDDICPSTRAVTVASALAAATLGVLMIWGVGFSPTASVHNAAHDVRHSTGFPCH